VGDTRRTRLLLGVALFAALVLMAVDYAGGSSPVMVAARGLVGSGLGAAERGMSVVTRPISRFFRSGLAGGAAGGRMAVLERQLAAMRAELSAAQLATARYRQLGALAGVSRAGGYTVLPAVVIAFGQGYQRTVTLDVGRADGVRPEQTVLDGAGLVGQVTAVGPKTCTVLLASDPSFVVGVRLAPSGEVGWVTGQSAGQGGPGLLRLSVLDPAAVLAPGEQLVTAASVRDRPFVPGVPVGTVALVRNRAGGLTAQALVRPFADLTALDVVGVVIGPPRVNPRFSVLGATAARGRRGP
jgi:rod shape-determining protein MreC